MGWTLFYMLVILKIPIVAAFVLIWYAAKPPEEEQGDGSGGDGGSGGHDVSPRYPRPPRRGPHRSPAPRAPQRVRARGRRLDPVPGRHA